MLGTRVLIASCAMLVQRLPERIVEKAVKGMLPSGRIGRHLFTHLKVRLPPLLGASHCMQALRPMLTTHRGGAAPYPITPVAGSHSRLMLCACAAACSAQVCQHDLERWRPQGPPCHADIPGLTLWAPPLKVMLIYLGCQGRQPVGSTLPCPARSTLIGPGIAAQSRMLCDGAEQP